MSQLINKSLFSPSIYYYSTIKYYNSNIQIFKEFESKLKKLDFNTYNEIIIGEIILNIENYKLFYLPVIKSSSVNLQSIDNSLSISKYKLNINNDEFKYIIIDIPHVSSFPFYRILLETKNVNSHSNNEKRHIFLNLIESFTYLLDAIERLTEKNIVHFNLKEDNILYNTISFNPQISDFRISIPINLLTNDNISHYFYSYSPSYYIWPLEVHIINFIINEITEPLSEKNAISIVKEYIKDNKVLLLFNKEFNNSFEIECLNQVRKYIEKDRNETIYKLLEFYKTWDNYSLSVLYLKFFYYIFNNKIQNNLFIYSFFQILSLNINPDPLKRLSIYQTQQKFNDLLYIDEIDYSIDIIELFDYDINLVSKQINEDLQQLNEIKKRENNNKIEYI